MRRYGAALVLVLCGAAVLRISLFSDLYLRYVQVGLRPYLIASGALLLALGLTAAVVAARAAGTGVDEQDDEQLDEGDDHGHSSHGRNHSDSHSHGLRVAWLLTVPALALLLFPPPALGAYSAERDAAAQYAAQGIGAFPALPAGDPVGLTLGQFTSRAVYDSAWTMGRAARFG